MVPLGPFLLGWTPRPAGKVEFLAQSRETPLRPPSPAARKNGQNSGAVAGQKKGHTVKFFQFVKPIMEVWNNMTTLNNGDGHDYEY